MTDQVNRIQFGTLTAEEWLRYAVVEITRPSSKGGTEKNRSGTPYDERMGALENGKKCLTCRFNNKNCVGHNGYIVLPQPVYNRQFFKIICYILQCVCPRCSRPRIIPEDAIFSGLTRISKYPRLKEFSKKCQSIETCPWEDCNDALPSFSHERNLDEIHMFYGKKKTAKKIPFTASRALAVFVRITNDHLKILGFNETLCETGEPEHVSVVESKEHIHQFRPESLIFTIFPVIPPIARPFVVRDEGEKCDDDLTDKYNSIVKLCIKLKEESLSMPGLRAKRISKQTEIDRKQQLANLQNHIWTLMDNRLEKSKLSSGGRPHKCLSSRIQGKDGHIQGNIGGKRVDFSARSVIVGGGILLRVDELGVPRYIAERLTKKELVKEWNRSYIQDLVAQGKVNRVERWVPDKKETRIIRVQHLRSFCLKIDDIAERQLRDGDWVMFNRQPTLRVESMQAFKVKIIEGYAFRLPLALTSPFNADFDGDEMNLHVPQGVQATAETAILMRTSARFITGQRNGPVAGIVQDGLVAAYLLTNTWAEGGSETLVKKTVFMDCVTSANISIQRYRDLLQRAQKWYPEFISEDLELEDHVPGKLMFSIVFPPNLCYQRKTDTSEEFPVVKIEGGVLLPDSGPVCKKIIGAIGGSLVQILWKEHSPELTSRFLSEIQFLTDYWLPHHGFSMGISDCQTTGRKEVARALAMTQIRVRELMKQYKGDELESEINAHLNEAGNIGPRIASLSMNKGERNSLNIMRRSGAKGNVANLSSIVAFVGQQNINGRRVPMTLTNDTRTLPRFEQGDISPEARGFVSSNYIDGLNPCEVYFHAMAGREGVIATAIRTAETGYIHKKLARKEEDKRLHRDGSIRDANGRITQFLYGDDGLDPQKLYGCPGVEFPFFVNPHSIAQKMNKDVERTREVTKKPRRLKKDVVALLLEYVKAGSPGIQTEVTQQATKSFRSSLKKGLRGVKLYECKIPDFCREIIDQLETSKAQHGDMVGLIASSSIGEPATQLTLNTFHYTGRKGMDVSLGIPRFKEILNVTESPKNPSCTIFFDDSFLKEGAQVVSKLEASLIKETKKNSQKTLEIMIKQNKAKSLRHLEGMRKTFEEIRVGSFILEYEMQYIASDVDPTTDASPANIIPYREYTQPWWVSLSRELHGSDSEYLPQHWVLIIRLDVNEMCRKSFTVEEIAEHIEESGEGSLLCTTSPNNMGILEVVTNFTEVRHFLKEKGFVKANNTLNSEGLPCRLLDDNLEFFLCRDSLIPFIKNITVSGIPKIHQVYPHEDPITHEWSLRTRGSNFKTILSIPGVDPVKTVTNSIWEIYRTLGVEAVRKFLIEEITRIISFGGTYINPRHIQLLVDSMTDSGDITNVNRNGIGRAEGPIKKIMFEQPVDNTVEAAAFGEVDMLRSVSSSIMYGKIATSGTGMVEVQNNDRVPVRPPRIPGNTLDTKRVVPRRKKKSTKIKMAD